MNFIRRNKIILTTSFTGVSYILYKKEYQLNKYNKTKCLSNENSKHENSKNENSEYDNKNKKNQFYSYEEVKKHNKMNDVWVTYKNGVYNISNFVNNHPGGKGKNYVSCWRCHRPILEFV